MVPCNAWFVLLYGSPYGFAGLSPWESSKRYNPPVYVRSGLHSCPQCTYVTEDMTKMTAHRHKHTGEPFQCHLCPAAFSQNGNLKRHIRTHTGERPFSCIHCSASFSEKRTLTDHLRIHTGERPFSCGHCNKSFSRKCTLNDHVYRRHIFKK